MTTFKCPICNYKGLYEPPYNAEGYGSYEICPCCGFEFGCDDYPEKEEAQLTWRKKWIDSGLIWFSNSRTHPEGWDGEKQLCDK